MRIGLKLAEISKSPSRLGMPVFGLNKVGGFGHSTYPLTLLSRISLAAREARKVTLRCIDIFHCLTRGDPQNERHRADLVLSLCSYATRLNPTDGDVLDAAEKAQKIHSEISRTNDDYCPELADSLTIYSEILLALGWR